MKKWSRKSDAKNIEKFCDENNLVLIEDSAEAHGQYVDNQICGSFGVVSTFSFYANKLITTGEGGAVITNKPKLKKGKVTNPILDLFIKFLLFINLSF